MKLRAIGTGSKFCRHPLVPSSWLIVSGKDLSLIGAPWPVVPALERYGYSIEEDLALITLISAQMDQIGGLFEIALRTRHRKKKVILAAPARLIESVRARFEQEIGLKLEESFDVKSVVRLGMREDYFTETISFVPNFMDTIAPSYGIRFESAKIFITGEAPFNEDWLFREMECDLILHAISTRIAQGSRAACLSQLQQLPMYLQNKMWIYGYEAEERDAEQPFPMMYLPPGAWVFDSDRRDKLLSKERFIRENSKKQI